MTINRQPISSTETTLTIGLSEAEMTPDYQQTVRQLATQLKVPGFRAGHTPTAVAVKHLDDQQLANAFLEQIVPRAATEVLNRQDQKPVLRPEVNVTKFVPFNQLEVTINYHHTSPIELADYNQLPVKRKPVASIPAKEIEVVVDRLRADLATTKQVQRAAKLGDKLTIDFEAQTKDGQPLLALSSKDHQLHLGQGSMPPGFEDKLVGLKPKTKTSFNLKLPDLPSIPELSGVEVKFSIQLNKIEALTLPAVDDKLAKKLGEYQTLAELKQAITDQLKASQKRQQILDLDQQLVTALRRLSQISLPKALIKEQLQQTLANQAQSLTRHGLSHQQWLKAHKLTAKEHRQQLRRLIRRNLKASFLLTEVATKEKLTVAKPDLDRALKASGQDPDKVDANISRRLSGQLLAEQTIKLLASKVE